MWTVKANIFITWTQYVTICILYVICIVNVLLMFVHLFPVNDNLIIYIFLFNPINYIEAGNVQYRFFYKISPNEVFCGNHHLQSISKCDFTFSNIFEKMKYNLTTKMSGHVG